MLTPISNKTNHPVLEWIAAFFFALSSSSLVIKYNLIFFGRNIIEPYVFLGGIAIFNASSGFLASASSTLKSTKFLMLLIFLSLMAALGAFTGDSTAGYYGNLVSSYSDYRSIIVLCFFFFLSQDKSFPLVVFDKIAFKFFLLLTILEIISVTFLNDISFNAYISDRQAIISMAPMYLVARFLLSGNVLLALGAIAISVMITIVSLMRINYVFLACEIIMVVYFSINYIISIRNVHKAIILLISSIFIAISSVPIAISFFESNTTRLIHGLYRIQELLGIRVNTITYEIERTRLNTNAIVFFEFDKFLAPMGLGATAHTPLVWHNFFDKYGVMSTNDASFFYLIYHFGLFLGLIFTIIILHLCFKFIVRMFRLPTYSILFTSGLFVLSFLALAITKSWPFIYWSIALQFAFLTPYITRPEDSWNLLNRK